MGNAEYVAPLTLEEKISQAIETCGVNFTQPEDVEKIVKVILSVLPKTKGDK